ncbi:MAG: hypothetical protein JSR48_14885 [Verrucomicrobia bacterium]|nr:hypothetical protein [Verrucomicrobiota bacterium]
MTTSVAIVWSGAAAGTVTVERGRLAALRPGGTDAAAAGRFELPEGRPGRIEADIDGTLADDETGTLVTVRTAAAAFTFRLRDVDRNYPIYVPAYDAAVTAADDRRSFAEIAAAVRHRGQLTKLQTIAAAPEENFDHAAANTRAMRLETWLGLSRDARIFRVDDRLQWIKPRFHWSESKLPETGGKPVVYEFQFGRGWGVRDDVTRRLEDGVLPILHGRIGDEDVQYDVTVFTSLERSPLTAATLRGTPFLVADSYGAGHMFTPVQQAEVTRQREAEANRDEETVLYVRGVATNRGTVPRYALFKTMTPQLVKRTEWHVDGARGFGLFKSGRVFAVTKLNGRPVGEEHSVLLKPGETAVFEMYVPHDPVSPERAGALLNQSFDARLAEARRFWQEKLAAAARWHLPESRIDEMVRAGLLHLDLITYGLEPGGPLIPTIGDYTAIGSESAPIIQFMDSMGWHDTARRAIGFFLEKQHDDGFMQNFNNYMLETGAVLWTMGEHYRYTHDDAWLREVKPRLLKACRYLQAWRARNQNGPKGDGFGMLDGKTADPDDPFRSFMLNGYAYLGLSRAAEMLATSDPAESKVWRNEAEALKTDIRDSLVHGLERAPVVPLGDGSWAPAAAPWTGYRGPVMLHADGGAWFTHGAMTGRDSLLGPLYLVFQEVIDPREPLAGLLLETHSELMTRQNVAFSQPYYSRHPWVHLQRGEVKPFLQAWYDTMAAIADRETYTFIEHFFGASPHKTHEEAWFLMETRWMLYLESGRTLRLLAGVPRAYLADGQTVAVDGAASYFGPLSFRLESHVAQGEIRAAVDCPGERRPATIEFRVPHPAGLRAKSVEGGIYDAATETVRIEHFTGAARITLHY